MTDRFSLTELIHRAQEGAAGCGQRPSRSFAQRSSISL
jgi:hypothetical protein